MPQNLDNKTYLLRIIRECMLQLCLEHELMETKTKDIIKECVASRETLVLGCQFAVSPTGGLL